jgi:hypothetical protein
VVELHARGAAEHSDRKLDIEAPVPDPEVVKVPERLAGEISQLRMVTLRFKLGDDHDRQDDMVLVEARESGRVCEQDARVEDVGTTVLRVGHAKLPWASGV